MLQERMEASAELEGFLLPVWDAMDEPYRCLPSLYLGFLSLWSFSGFYWILNTWRNHHFQSSNLQWTLASVPLTKIVQLGLSFLFWYSCFNIETCSLWMSFGAYVSGVLFQTASFVAFLLISHGYCIMCEHLSVRERRTTAALGCVLYLVLIGYQVDVPYFTVFVLLTYLVSFYMIFHRISQNISTLNEQLSFIEDEDVHEMHEVVHTKYTMFKKFQGAIQILAVAEIAIHINVDDAVENYWFRLLVREWAQFCIFMYIGWIFRRQEVSPHFFIMPTMKSGGEMALPPIYSLEINAADFKDLGSQAWQVAVPTPFPSDNQQRSMESILIVVQHPCYVNRAATEDLSGQKTSVCCQSQQQHVD